MYKIFEQFKNDKFFEGEDTGGSGSESEVIEEALENANEEETGEEEEIIEEAPVEEEEELDENGEKKPKKEEKDDKDTETTEEQKKDSVIKQALTKYPKLFKEYPELRAAYFEQKQFKEVFTTVEEAKEADTNSKILANLSQELQTGDPKKVIEYLKTEPKILTQFARNFIKDLPKEVYSDALAPTVIEMLKEIEESAKLHKNENLLHSVGWISKYLFGKETLPEIKNEKIETKEEKENPALTQLAKNFHEEVTEDVTTELNSTIDTSLASLKNVKPAVRKTIISEIKEEIDGAFREDSAHNNLMKKLWADAKKSNYSRQAKASIKTAFLAAVKKRLPEVRAKVLKNNGYVIKQGQKKTTTDTSTTNFRKINNSSSNTSSRDDKVAQLKKEGKSEREILDAIV